MPLVKPASSIKSVLYCNKERPAADFRIKAARTFSCSAAPLKGLAYTASLKPPNFELPFLNARHRFRGMYFSAPLVRGRLIRRYKRFLADIHLDTEGEITASVPNTGSMLGLAEPGMGVWLSQSSAPARKYRYRLELVETPNTLVGVNTGLPNCIAEEAICNGLLPELSGYDRILREQPYDRNSRIDMLYVTNQAKMPILKLRMSTICAHRAWRSFLTRSLRAGQSILPHLAILSGPDTGGSCFLSFSAMIAISLRSAMIWTLFMGINLNLHDKAELRLMLSGAK